jgi:phosphopantothenoylcysteine decarboxylase / phosphopantothenate---cysteine ligase
MAAWMSWTESWRGFAELASFTGQGRAPMADSKNILLGISGGIAAYKCCELIRRLRDQGHAVQVVLTENAQHFVSATTLQALSGQPVRSSLWDAAAEAAMGHIELARWADVMLIAPASANTMAKLAHGFACDLLSTLVLASAAPLLLAPAMNQQMWAHPATQANLQTLQARGVRCIGPNSGAQACGDVGAGRMAEVPELLAELLAVLQGSHPRTQFLAGKRIWINAGPTREPLDPVRFISNLSSGKMGFALAQAAAAAGAEVTLVAGPCALPTPLGVHRIDVETAEEMAAACQDALTQADWFIGAAAVADYRCKQQAPEKIKKQAAQMTIELVRNPDIIAELAAKKRGNTPIMIGFAAETEQLLAHAKDKRARKGLNFILANPVGRNLGMETADNELWLLGEGVELHFPRADKQALAHAVLKKLSELAV